MKLILVLILLYLLSHGTEGQIQPSIVFDPNSGDYILRYQSGAIVVEKYFTPATKIDPTVIAEVVALQGTFMFRYSIHNGSGGQQRLLSFTLVSAAEIVRKETPNSQWSVDRAGFVNGIDWAQTMADPTGAATPSCGIAPGSSSGGFSISSYGLPGITDAYFQGLTGMMTFEEEPSDEVERLLRTVDRFPVNYVQRKTIGPVTPPSDLVPLSILDTIISYKLYSADRGWIINKGIINGLDQKLENAKKQLERGNSKTAKNILEAFVNEVEALNKKGKQLTSEAYALLKFNAEYLISKL